MIIVYPDLKFVPETNVDEKIRQSITDFTLLMNKYYGYDRDICKDIGGFACIVESEDDVDELKNEYFLDLNNDIFEEEEIIGDYIGRLYILSCDYSIKVYFRRELIE